MSFGLSKSPEGELALRRAFTASLHLEENLSVDIPFREQRDLKADGMAWRLRHGLLKSRLANAEEVIEMVKCYGQEGVNVNGTVGTILARISSRLDVNLGDLILAARMPLDILRIVSPKRRF